MVEDIAKVLEALHADTSPRAVRPAAAIRRRGDRRRAAIRVAAAGGTVAFVGATAGTAFAVAQLPSQDHHRGFGIATSSSPSASPGQEVAVLREELRTLAARQASIRRRLVHTNAPNTKARLYAQLSELDAMIAQLTTESRALGADSLSTPTASPSPGSGLSDQPPAQPDQPTPSPTPHAS